MISQKLKIQFSTISSRQTRFAQSRMACDSSIDNETIWLNDYYNDDDEKNQFNVAIDGNKSRLEAACNEQSLAWKTIQRRDSISQDIFTHVWHKISFSIFSIFDRIPARMNIKLVKNEQIKTFSSFFHSIYEENL